MAISVVGGAGFAKTVTDDASQSNTAPNITLPASLATGDYGLLLLSANSGSITISSGFSGWTVHASSPVSGASTLEIWLLTKNLTAADSSTSVSGVLSATARWGMAGVVLRGTAQAIDFYASSNGGTATSTSLTHAAVTPVANDCLRVTMIGARRAANDTVTSTPPASWTEQVDGWSAHTVSPRNGAFIDTIQLVGQAGVSQGAVNGTATLAVVQAAFHLTVAPAAASGLSGAASDTTVTVSRTSGGVRGVVAAAALALTVGLTATGVVGTSTGSSSSVTAASASTGVVGATTGSSRTVTVGLTASGVVGASSGSSLAVTVTLASTGTVASGLSGTSSLAETVALSSTGVVGAATGSSLAETVSRASTGVVGVSSGGSLAETVSLASAGAVGKVSASALAETAALSATGVTGVTTGATSAVAASATSTGVVGSVAGGTRPGVVTATATGVVAEAAAVGATLFRVTVDPNPYRVTVDPRPFDIAVDPDGWRAVVEPDPYDVSVDPSLWRVTVDG